MEPDLRVLPYGRRAMLVELPDARTRRAVTRTLQDHTVPGVDVVPAESTILLDISDPAVPDDAARALLADARRMVDALDLAALPPEEVRGGTPVTIDVQYHGPDLAEVAELFGGSVDAFIDWHTATPWMVEFLGFMPGFGYLTRPDHAERVARRESPRSVIPAGSVGLAGSYCGIYPGTSPGGWQLIGHTDTVLFDPSGAGALLRATDSVQFRAGR
ncbi:5-oxoprolinase subunit B family protein [Flexivirga caeni]|nr:carboxyltransferase domain-containing protein [Flexivirga caeni]